MEEISAPDSHDVLLLQEMLRESERILDHQVRAFEELDDKSEHMLTLGVAAVGGGVTLTSLAIVYTRDSIDSFFLAGILLAGLFNLGSLLLFSGSYIGFRRHTEIHIGPRLSWIASKSNDGTWKILDHYLSVLKDYPSYFEWNRKKMATSASRRVRGLYLLLGAVLSYSWAFGYILQHTIGDVG